MSLNLANLRVYALGLAHRAVHDISRDNFRQLRNYVDMCAVLTNDDGRKHFFEPAQVVLEKTDSLYYPLIQRLLNTVSEDIICTAGVNLGIDALTYGASRLKAVAAETGRPVAWLTVASAAQAETPAFEAHVTEGEARGQYLWLVCSDDACGAAVQLSERHPKSNVILVLPPEAVTPEAVAAFRGCHNLIAVLSLPAPELSDTAHAAVALLKEEKLLYGLTVALTDDTVDEASHGAWPCILAQDALFCVYTHRGMQEARCAELYRRLCTLRTSTGSSALLLDWEKDTAQISRFISPLAQVEHWNAAPPDTAEPVPFVPPVPEA